MPLRLLLRAVLPLRPAGLTTAAVFVGGGGVSWAFGAVPNRLILPVIVFPALSKGLPMHMIIPWLIL